MQSMEEIYQQHARTVYKFILSMTHDEDLSEELTQETFYQAIRSIDRFDNSCSVSTWLCAIAKNQLAVYRRKHPVHTDLQDYTQTAGSAEEDIIASSDRVELMKKLHGCPEPYREIIYMRVFGDLSFREIGEIMGKTENWARVNFYRGKERLRKEITGNEK